MMAYVKIHRNVFQPIEYLIKIGLYKNEQEEPVESKEMFISDVIAELKKLDYATK